MLLLIKNVPCFSFCHKHTDDGGLIDEDLEDLCVGVRRESPYKKLYVLNTLGGEPNASYRLAQLIGLLKAK